MKKFGRASIFSRSAMDSGRMQSHGIWKVQTVLTTGELVFIGAECADDHSSRVNAAYGHAVAKKQPSHEQTVDVTAGLSCEKTTSTDV